MSFFIVRLLQNFDNVTVDMDAQPQRTTSLLEWKTKRREVERDLLAVRLGLATKVGFGPHVCRPTSDVLVTGWYMDQDERGSLLKQGPRLRGVEIYSVEVGERVGGINGELPSQPDTHIPLVEKRKHRYKGRLLSHVRRRYIPTASFSTRTARQVQFGGGGSLSNRVRGPSRYPNQSHSRPHRRPQVAAPDS